jgi:hypothetical protein
MNELGASIMRAIEERFEDRRPRSPEPRRNADQPAAQRVAQAKMLPREQEGGEWRVVERRPRKERAARKEEKKRGNACCSFVKTNGRTEDGRCTSDQERNGAGDEYGRAPPRTAYVRGNVDYQRGG